MEWLKLGRFFCGSVYLHHNVPHCLLLKESPKESIKTTPSKDKDYGNDSQRPEASEERKEK